MVKLNNLVISSFIFILLACNYSGDENIIEESGTIEATTILLSSQTTGTVQKMLYDEGDVIKKGDTLLIIEHDVPLLKLRQAEAQKKAAKAQLDLAINGARDEDISLAREQLFQARSNFELAEKDYTRMRSLYSEQVITKRQFDETEAKYQISRSQLNAAQENLKKIENISRPEEIIQIRSNFENASANVDLIKKQIKDSHVISPINGFVVESFMELGETVNRGSSVFKLSDLSKVELTIYVRETQLGKIKLGQSAKVSNDTYVNKDYDGKVIYISPEAEFTPKNIQTKDERTKLVFKVKIELENPEFELKAGMPADAKIFLNYE